MRINWHVFQSGPYRAEGNIFQAGAKPSERALLFCPGFPGMGATLFEQRHAAAIAATGVDVIVIKHKGIRLDSPTGPVMVNNAVRLMQARMNAEKYIGGSLATIDEWLCEPYPVLQWMAAHYESFDIIGNSFGALSALWSLTMDDAPADRVGSLLLYAGAQGVADGTPESVMRIWKPEYIVMPRVTDKVALEDAESIVERLRTVYKDLPGRVKARLPAKVAVTYLVVAKDEILTVADTVAFQGAIGDRGRIVMDEVDCAWPDYGLLAHDTPNYKTEDLLALLRG